MGQGEGGCLVLMPKQGLRSCGSSKAQWFFGLGKGLLEGGRHFSRRQGEKLRVSLER